MKICLLVPLLLLVVDSDGFQQASLRRCNIRPTTVTSLAATGPHLATSPSPASKGDDGLQYSLVTRKTILSVLSGFVVAAAAAAAAGTVDPANAAIDVDAVSPQPTTATSIPPCPKVSSGNSNCVSTASVRQVDLYMPPWTFPESMSSDEAMARLKGVISSDPKLEIIGQGADRSLKVKATRNLGATDEIDFLINPTDSVITFISRRTDDEDGGDFGANRKRLEELRRKAQVFGIMGQEYSSADTAPREGAFGQLKAFYGLRSGGGYEDLLLDD